MRTLDWDDGTVRMIDQTRLPHDEVVLVVRDVDALVGHIQSLAVRGAMALGVAGAMGVALAAVRSQERGGDLDADLEAAAEALSTARPTAVNLSVGVERVMRVRRGGGDVDALVAEALRARDDDIAQNLAIGERGADLLAGTRTVLTHCNAGALAGVEHGTALSVISALHRRAPLEVVYVCETRPLLQGSRLTAWELGRAGIPHRVIVDGAAAGLVAAGAVGAVVTGADRIAANGDVANKVGTLAHALAARYAEVPFVVAAPEDTIDQHTPSGADVSIELREEDEVLGWGGRRTAPAGTRALNPAFDVTPADLLTAIVTEHRTVRPGGGAGVPPRTQEARTAAPPTHPAPPDGTVPSAT